MNNFLYQIASNYIKHHHDSLARFTFVFPGKRAGLFFTKYLNEIIDTPLLAPRVLTISSLMEEFSGLQAIHNTSLLFELYQAYSKVHPNPESFDQFIFWGEMIAADFNDIDQYHVDPEQLFTNLTDLKQIDTHYDFLEQEQVEAIRSFWNNFNPVNTENKEEFLKTWNLLLPIYQELNKQLKATKQTYMGALYKEAVIQLRTQAGLLDKQTTERYIFCGFNALSSCEEQVFSLLQTHNKADFYWDYTDDFMHDTQNPAFSFIRKHKKKFPSKYPLQAHQAVKKTIHSIAIPSAIGQAQHAGYLLDQVLPKHTLNEETAWVLADENLLIPALQSLPASLDKVNVTMGYPLKNSLVYQLLNLLIDLHKRQYERKGSTDFHYKQVLPILRHPLLTPILTPEEKAVEEQIISGNKIFISSRFFNAFPTLSILFTHVTCPQSCAQYLEKVGLTLQGGHQLSQKNTQLSRLEKEFIYYFFTHIQQLKTAIDKYGIILEIDTYFSLLRRFFERASVAFQGEPLCGLQILGTLETRCIDFKNIIITSVNEEVFPQKDNSPSFIPYNIRRGFGLPTSEEKDAMHAYYFFRLLGRAEKVWLLHDQRSSGLSSGEASRYTHLLKYYYSTKHAHLSFHEKQLSIPVTLQHNSGFTVAKGEVIQQHLNHYLKTGSKRLSASALNTFLDCSFKFYLKYIQGIKETKTIYEDVDNAMFGTIVHQILENLYAPFSDKEVLEQDLHKLRKDKQTIRREILSTFIHIRYPQALIENTPIKGKDQLTLNIIEKYIDKVILHDASLCPFHYIKGEGLVEGVVTINSLKQEVKIKGYIDRIDILRGQTRIIDYKTGDESLTLNRIEDLFDSKKEKRPKGVMQLLCYCKLLKQDPNYQDAKLSPHIYPIKSVFSASFSTGISFQRKPLIAYDEIDEIFDEGLQQTLSSLFSPDIPFQQTTQKAHCKYCSFKRICK